MNAEYLIEMVLSGKSVKDALDEAAPPNPLALRKRIRKSFPGLHKFLSDRGDLHDFSLFLVTDSPSLDDVMKKQQLPKDFRRDVASLLASMES